VPQQAYALFSGFALVLGLVVGSFLNVCIARMPEDRSIVHPPSHCPSCGAFIEPYDNIPVLSWLLLRGRCRSCHTRISPLYPAIELLTGLLAWLVFRRVVGGPEHFDLPHLAAFGVFFVFVAMLVAQTFIDIRHYIIPDEFSIYAVPVGVAASALLSWLGYPEAVSWRQAALGALFGSSVLLFVMALFWLIRRKEGMGFGDVKLLAMIGSFLGAWPALPFVVFASSLIGAAVGIPVALSRGRGLGSALPFGPFLALAAIVYVLHGPELVERWLPGWSLLLR